LGKKYLTSENIYVYYLFYYLISKQISKLLPVNIYRSYGALTSWEKLKYLGRTQFDLYDTSVPSDIQNKYPVEKLSARG
jgi:hypothetical protein